MCDQGGKILIAGVGRSGTTFLMRLFTFLGLDTGYTKDVNKQDIHANCNSGMEERGHAPTISKNPEYCFRLVNLASKITIDHIVVPVRNLRKAAESRVRLGVAPGGLWRTRDPEAQIDVLHEALATLIQDAALLDIPTTFISFEKMTEDPEYLARKLKFMFVRFNIQMDDFLREYGTASVLSRPK